MHAASDPDVAILQFSQRCDLEYKLAVAREFRDERAFYFPHNVDFRCVHMQALNPHCNCRLHHAEYVGGSKHWRNSGHTVVARSHTVQCRSFPHHDMGTVLCAGAAHTLCTRI